MSAAPLILDEEKKRPRLFSAFAPPRLPPVSNRAFRFHMSYSLLDALTAGILSNVPLMAVKALHASDAQLQIPIMMTSIGLFSSVFTGVAMAKRNKKPFVVGPGLVSGLAALVMAWTNSVQWFLCLFGMISVFDFAIRPAIPSMLRIVYPDHCRSHVSGTLRQYASVVFLGSSLLFSFLLSLSGAHIREVIRAELTLAGICSMAAFYCFNKLPDRGDGSLDEAMPSQTPARLFGAGHPILAPLRDNAFRFFLGAFFLYCCGNLFYMGIVAPFFAKDLGFDYVYATLLIHIVPAITGFLFGGKLTAWFDRTSVWRSYSVVFFLWGLDPVLLALFPHLLPALVLARISRGPATLGGMVLTVYTAVHRFARPGAETSCYMAVLFFVNGIARVAAPGAAALLTGVLPHRTILFLGGVSVLSASALLFYGGMRYPARGEHQKTAC
jgi:MFS family permease